MALSSHGNDMGEESGKKWHMQALEVCVRACVHACVYVSVSL
jgi:hypothetical protein